ncbi:hypothetical protein CCACVL1_25468 [Corchorus capsularis]|uniref:Uncharacterized protein n=1 Tax=Corchorus capsularis TaxID=210143 RepID=A0A1R3GJW5_COCAP|nr:hypothetical protein CCACVL1_25468 [Corchorus capsularis]
MARELQYENSIHRTERISFKPKDWPKWLPWPPKKPIKVPKIDPPPPAPRCLKVGKKIVCQKPRCLKVGKKIVCQKPPATATVP